MEFDMSNRPWYWQILPDRVKTNLYNRFIYPPSPKWERLYEAARLRYAPEIKVKLEKNDRMHGLIAFLGYYEKDLSQTIVHLAQEEGGRLVDVGANIGYFSLLWSSQSRTENTAYAIEPSPRVTSLLERNVQKNGLESKIEIVEAAAGYESGEIEFDVGPEKEVGWGGIAETGEPVTDGSKDVIRVPQVRLDEIIEGPISVLKIDAEGSDTWVLQGAEELLKKKQVRRVFFEHNLVRARRLGIDEKEPMRLLHGWGYKVKERNNGWWAKPAKS